MRAVLHLDPDDARRVPWKNGRGVTEELALWPPHARFERGDFEWRISKARIEDAGPFSNFEHHDRILVVTAGDGLVLDHGRRAARALAAARALSLPRRLADRSRAARAEPCPTSTSSRGVTPSKPMSKRSRSARAARANRSVRATPSCTSCAALSRRAPSAKKRPSNSTPARACGSRTRPSKRKSTSPARRRLRAAHGAHRPRARALTGPARNREKTAPEGL